MYYQMTKTPLGNAIMESDGEALTGLYLQAQPGYDRLAEKLQNQENANNEVSETAERIFDLTKQWLKQYFGGEQPNIEVPLRVSGTLFQEDVWGILREIPYGETTTYGEIAERIAKKRDMRKMSAQAVGQAVGHNPISILIPCHRVLGKDRSLTGYAGGVDKKEFLLHLEKVKDFHQ